MYLKTIRSKAPVLFLTLVLCLVFVAGVLPLQSIKKQEVEKGVCANEVMRQWFFQQHPEAHPDVNPAHQQLEDFTQEFIAREKQMRDQLSTVMATEVLTIPVVFHIIHQNGEENISDAQVLSCLQAMNEDFSDTNPDRGNLVAAFQGLEGNTYVEFALPTKDPDGNPTTGIERHYDTDFVDGNDIAMKQLYGWPREMYLNVYVVYSASGGNSSGFSYLPADVDDWPEYDGIVASHWAVGTIGTAIPSHTRLVSHEAGHWANLYHTWGTTANQGSQRACRQDDAVDDTPNCVGFWGGDADGGPDGCNTAHTSCSSLDMIQNHMDYSFCPIVFTIGQSDRMRAALNSGVSQRNNLWSPANLAAVGLGDPLPSYDIYVQNIAMTTAKKGKNYKANATITVFDELGNPVPNATVFVDWSGLVTGSDSGTTASDGTVTIISPQTRNIGTFTVTVTNITHSTNVYNASLNIETSDSISN
jgi:hypothetical protein